MERINLIPFYYLISFIDVLRYNTMQYAGKFMRSNLKPYTLSKSLFIGNADRNSYSSFTYNNSLSRYVK